MRVEHIPCGPFVNASEQKALAHLRAKLQSEPGDERFVILTNLTHSAGATTTPDEIDMVILGPGGVHIVEVKHWDRNSLKREKWSVENEADKLERKTRKVATKLRAIHSDLGHVSGRMLLTKEPRSLRMSGPSPVHGIQLYALADWKELVDLGRCANLSDALLNRFAEVLAPRAAITIEGKLRRLGHVLDLEPLTPPDERFHRVYRGRHGISQDRVVLHLYDLSATEAANARSTAERDFRVLRQLQKSPWLPAMVDSLQDLPGYPGELLFYTVADSGAPSLAERARDPSWSIADRLAFAEAALIALGQLHAPPHDLGPGIVHRTITPDEIRVRSGNRPLFIGWQWARHPDLATVSANAPRPVDPRYTAPEVIAGGLATADQRSDVYALCACLRDLFQGQEANEAKLALEMLGRGIADDQDARPALGALAEELRGLIEALEAPPEPAAPAPFQEWAEDTNRIIDGHRYRVIGQLGRGGVGRTFKLAQIDPSSGEDLGTFVAKVVANAEAGQSALDAYRRVRPHTKHPQLALVYSTADEWRPDAALALLEWVDGAPIGDYAGVIELYADELGEAAPEGLVLSWLHDLCAGLGNLHRVGLVHGDVSPGNILVNGAKVTLIDYDLVTRRGEIAAGEGTPPYRSPALAARRPVDFADDLFALAATVFHLVTERQPFLHDGVRAVEKGLGWTADDRARYPRVAAFCDRATASAAAERLGDGIAAAAYVQTLIEGGRKPEEGLAGPALPLPLRENEVPWLGQVLQAYPGGRYGNVETRGLDSDFAGETYVETGLDAALLRDIRAGAVKLVILCGNAGDGKTALLQHLAESLGLGRPSSSQRIWEETLPDGTRVKANLDGAAAWQGRSADDLMDEILAPFHNGSPVQRIVHLVAVNDGRLLEWIEGYEARHGASRLTGQLADALGERNDVLDRHIRLIELNLRSLVGGLSSDGERIQAEWLGRLIDGLVGGARAAEVWKPCLTCAAQSRCTAWASAAMLGASEDQRVRAKGRLFVARLTDALQAVHQRNEVHITAREVKAALSYILFGLDWCRDLHERPGHTPPAAYDLAFDPEAPRRQGELLGELIHLDPALESNPRIDRYLTSAQEPDSGHGAPRYPGLSLKSARRRAYFEWTEEQILAVGGARYALQLANGRHLRRFRNFPLVAPAERQKVLEDVCRGISRLEDLPHKALDRHGVVPVRIIPRTPTETAFWVEKPLDRFTLAAEAFDVPEGLETLHRWLILTYASADGRNERLLIPFSLFALLLDLGEGVQLLDAASDDVFANLSVFTQRLAQEDERRLLAWNPSAEEMVFELSARMANAGQIIGIRAANSQGP